jgi:hypothetical protein
MSNIAVPFERGLMVRKFIDFRKGFPLLLGMLLVLSLGSRAAEPQTQDSSTKAQLKPPQFNRTHPASSMPER